MKRILIFGLIVLLVLPFTFATEYIGNLNSEGEYSIKDNTASESTPSTSSTSSSGGGGGGSSLNTEISTAETNNESIGIDSVSNSQTRNNEDGTSSNNQKIIYEQNENFFSGLGKSVLNLFGFSEQSQLTGAAVGTNTAYKNVGYAVILFVFILGMVSVVMIRKTRKR
jgi:hypothetical protein